MSTIKFVTLFEMLLFILQQAQVSVISSIYLFSLKYCCKYVTW